MAREGRFEDLKGVSRNNMFLIDVDAIGIEDGFNTRKDFGDIEALAAKIRKRGILQPLRVRRDGDKVMLVAGERRLRAVQLLREQGVKFERVPCVLADRHANETDNILDMLAENADRKDLTPIEEAEGFARLMKYGMTEQQVAEEFGISESTLKNRLELLKASPAARKALQDGKASSAAVIQILRRYESREEQDGALKDAIQAAGPTGSVSKGAVKRKAETEGKGGQVRTRAMGWQELDALQKKIARRLKDKPDRHLEGIREGLRIAMKAAEPPDLGEVKAPKKPTLPPRAEA